MTRSAIAYALTTKGKIMKFNVLTPEQAEIGNETNGSHALGSVDVPYARIVQVFGAPSLDGAYWADGDGKVRVEWIIKFEDGRLATIYDWKERQPVRRVTDWHIGGFDSEVTARVQYLLTTALCAVSS